MRTADVERDIIRVYSRFPKALFEQLETYARTNKRSIGQSCEILCEAALRERDAGKQEQRASNAAN